MKYIYLARFFFTTWPHLTSVASSKKKKKAIIQRYYGEEANRH